MRSSLSVPALSACALLVLGCQADAPVLIDTGAGPAFTGPAPTLTTDRTTYVAANDPAFTRWKFSVIATLQNNSDQTVYIARCGSPAPSYGLLPDSGQSAYEPWYACGGGAIGIEVAPHSLRIDTLEVAGPNSVEERTGAFLGSLNGKLTLTYALATCIAVDECRAGRFAAVSAPFVVSATR